MSAEPADHEHEAMSIVSYNLQDAMEAMAAARPASFVGWGDKHNTKAPYLHLYHTRSIIKQLAPHILSSVQQNHISVLLEYLECSYGREYADADHQFASGQVTRAHFSKLFGPNEIILDSTSGQTMAYVSRNCPQDDDESLALHCHHWAFDGHFHQEDRNMAVSWPKNDSDKIPITSLSVYPLKFDQSGLEEKLRARGQTFWKCRKRNFVSYESPSRSFDIGVVPTPLSRLFRLEPD
jgi:hypothetical protein